MSFISHLQKMEINEEIMRNADSSKVLTIGPSTKTEPLFLKPKSLSVMLDEYYRSELSN